MASSSRLIFLLLHLAIPTVTSSSNLSTILLVVVDDLGSADLGLTGSRIATPAIDALAQGGTMLSEYHVYRACSPTRAALLTSRFVMRYGLQSGVLEPTKPYGLSLNETLLPERLGRLGWTSHAIGKWHLGYFAWPYNPTFRGFDSYYGYLTGGEDYFTHESYNGGYDLHLDEGRSCGAGCRKEPWEDRGTYSTHLFTRRAQEIVRAAPAEEKLFLYLAYQAVHSPAQVPLQYKAPYVGQFPDPLRVTFAGMLAALDEGIANLTETLRESGRWDSTLLVLTSDNGAPTTGCGGAQGGQNWPLRGGKCSAWQGGNKVTSFAHGPGVGVVANRTLDHLSHAVDWGVTILSFAEHASGSEPARDQVKARAGAMMAGAAAEKTHDKMLLPMDGVDLRPALMDSQHVLPPARQTPLILEADPYASPLDKDFGGDQHATPYYAIRDDRHKLILGDPGQPGILDGWYCTGPPCPATHNNSANASAAPKYDALTVLLFDLVADPGEHNDVASEMPEVVAALRQALEAFNATAVSSAQQGMPEDPRGDPKRHNGTVTPWVDLVVPRGRQVGVEASSSSSSEALSSSSSFCDAAQRCDDCLTPGICHRSCAVGTFCRDTCCPSSQPMPASFVASGATPASAPAPAPAPLYTKRGVVEVGTFENTLFWWQGTLLNLENIPCTYPGHAGEWEPATFGNHSYARIRDFSTGAVLANVTETVGFGFISAFPDYEHGRLWLFGTPADRCHGNGAPTTVQAWSNNGSDWADWDSALAFDLGSATHNVQVSKVGPMGAAPAPPMPAGGPLPPHRYVMMLECFTWALNNNADGDLTHGWFLLANSTRPAHDAPCGGPSLRYNPTDARYYVVTGGRTVELYRTADFQGWERQNRTAHFIEPSAGDAQVAPFMAFPSRAAHVGSPPAACVGCGPQAGEAARPFEPWWEGKNNYTKWDQNSNDADMCCLHPDANKHGAFLIWGASTQGRRPLPPLTGSDAGTNAVATATLPLDQLLMAYFDPAAPAAPEKMRPLPKSRVSRDVVTEEEEEENNDAAASWTKRLCPQLSSGTSFSRADRLLVHAGGWIAIAVKEEKDDADASTTSTSTTGSTSMPPLELLLALRHPAEATHRLTSAVTNVSDPTSPQYGKHLSTSELRDIVAAPAEAVAAVMAWLSPHGEAHVVATGDFIRFKASSMRSATQLFRRDPQFRAFTHPGSSMPERQILRATRAPLLPAAVRPHIQLVRGLCDFPDLDKRRRGRGRAASRRLQRSSSASSLSSPSSVAEPSPASPCTFAFFAFPTLVAAGDGVVNVTLSWSCSGSGSDSGSGKSVKDVVDHFALELTQAGRTLTARAPVAAARGSVCGTPVWAGGNPVCQVGWDVGTNLKNHVPVTGLAVTPVFVGGAAGVVLTHHHAVVPTPWATPSRVRRMYNVSVPVPSQQEQEKQKQKQKQLGSVAVLEFGGSFDPHDVAVFAAAHGEEPGMFPPVTVVGRNNPARPDTENTMDVQWMLAMTLGRVAPFYWGYADDKWLLDWAADVSDATDPPLVWSLSFGEPEDGGDDDGLTRTNTELQKMAARGLTIVSTSGDWGSSDNLNCSRFWPDFPSSSPYTTSVGATTTTTTTRAKTEVEVEVACSTESVGCSFTTGGGFSSRWATPAWQAEAVAAYVKDPSRVNASNAAFFNASGRGFNDVTALGNNMQMVIAGAASTCGVGGGTSAAGPIVAGLLALVNAARLEAGHPPLGHANPLLYSLAASGESESGAAFNVVRSEDGRNSNQCTSEPAYACCAQGFREAAAGWDPLSGLGSLNFGGLVARAAGDEFNRHK